ncbi:hypothetical protein BEL04_05675 [Mucilaginibacter sp. PPCGB 2223]|uniref:DUF4062 domain-containing protein n=1 Tax=Mucilaginibacter sp. PPCGB 2223 TaxID=1886027 RepID=UPI000825DFDA|nr:DUF4062 domain-containing protein [Mucilaginibacter sp. PPCGB 2223]OCX53776.1 hypothetical protein BEL04_05675 [Mucilaginibacter sp. PPCGB 2223]
MKDKKLQIFVSSTYLDLLQERQAAVEAILSSGHIPAGMELFAAGDESQMIVIKRWIDESDIYLLILGGRYGSIDRKTGKSYTHLEFEYAIKKRKPLFALVISEEALDNKAAILGRSGFEQEHQKELKKFKSIVLKNLVKFWSDCKDIKIGIHETISEFSYRKELVGWIRGDNAVNTGFLAEEIARLTKENSELRNKLSNLTYPESLYSTLSYRQMEELLGKQIIVLNEKEMTLFDVIISYGEQLTKKLFIDNIQERRNFEKLKLYKLIEKDPTYLDEFRFTEEGHNFYLRALAMNQK